MGSLKRMTARLWDGVFLYTLLAVCIGLLAGAVILLLTGFNPLSAYATLFVGIFGSGRTMLYAVQYATPIILTGLSVTFAFKTGLFNIGAEGQYIMGAVTALAVSVLIPMPFGIHGAVCVLIGGLAGACLGGIAGLLKAFKGIHEVIVTIMLNWIAFYLSNFLVMSAALKKPNSTASVDIAETSRIYTNAFRESLGTVKIHWGTVVALVAVVLCWLILNKTTLSYQLRAVGFNRNAAEYGGIPVKRSIVVSMGISGLLAGTGGAVQVLGVVGRITQLSAQEGYGFDGISVSMIGAVNPVGALFSGLFYGGLKYGGSKLNIIGAFTCAAAATLTGNPWLGLLAGTAAGAFFGCLHALASITFKADRTVSGIAINLLAPGASIYFCKALFEGSTQTRPVELSGKLPVVLGSVFPGGSFLNYTFKNYVSVYCCLLLAAGVWFLLQKTRLGLRIRSVGEHPRAAETLGISVFGVRYCCVILFGALAALGGAVIPLSTVSYFFPSIISGQGFIAIAAVIFGKFKPRTTVLACLLFGFCKSLSLTLGNPKFGLSVSTHLLNMIPYIITLLTLLFIGRSRAPAASGKIYDPAAG